MMDDPQTMHILHWHTSCQLHSLPNT